MPSPTPAPPLVDAAAATPSLRTLGTGATQAAPGDDSRFGNPTNAQTTPAANKIPLSGVTGVIDAGWVHIAARLTVVAQALDLAATAVTANSYGSASSVGTFTVDAYGRLTAAASTAISITSSAISDSTTAGRALLTAVSTAAQRTALSLVVGTNVQAYSSVLDTVATIGADNTFLRVRSGALGYGSVLGSDLSGTVAIANGGTGQVIAAAAFAALISGTTISIAQGGTGQVTAAAAFAALITGTTISIAQGGTGQVTAAAAFAALISGTTISIAQGGTGATTAVAGLDALHGTIATIASATTTDLSTATGEYSIISGSVTITSFGTVAAGAARVLRFSGTPVVTHNATSLILPGGANITAAAGDVMYLHSLGSGNWRCTSYLRGGVVPYSGDISALTGTLAIGNGGTGQTSAAAAFAALISGTTITIAQGGTGQTSAAAAFAALISGTTISIAQGGTGQVTAAAAFAALITGTTISIAQGGTGQVTAAAAFAALISGTTISIAQGGTGQTTANAALNALQALTLAQTSTLSLSDNVTATGTIGQVLKHITSGTAAAGFGFGTAWDLQSGPGTLLRVGSDVTTLITATPDASVEARRTFSLMAAGVLSPVAGIGWMNSGTGAMIYAGDPGNQSGLRWESGNLVRILAGGSVHFQAQSGVATLPVRTVMSGSRFSLVKGTGATAANTLTVSSDGNYCVITGTTTVNGIVTTNWQAGSEISLELPSGITITHNSGSPGASAVALLLRGAADLTTTGTYVLKLTYNGTNWIEDGGQLTPMVLKDTSTSAVSEALALKHISTGTTVAGFGSLMAVDLQSGASTVVRAMTDTTKYTVVSGSPTATRTIALVQAGTVTDSAVFGSSADYSGANFPAVGTDLAPTLTVGVASNKSGLSGQAGFLNFHTGGVQVAYTTAATWFFRCNVEIDSGGLYVGDNLINATTGSKSFAFSTGIGAAYLTISSEKNAIKLVAQVPTSNNTASTEAVGVDFDLSRTSTWAAGALTTQREVAFRAPTYAFASASTVTTAATVAITAAPIAGTNATITDAYALWVQAGAARYDGRVVQSKGADVASANTLTLGTDGNYFVITGSTTIKGVTTTGWRAGTKISLQLPSGLTVNHSDGSPGAGAVAILLRNSVNLVTTGTYLLSLEYNGTNWVQPGAIIDSYRPLQGAALTDASATVNPGTDKVSEYVLSVAITATRALTLGTTGSPKTGQMVRIVRKDTAALTYIITNGGTNGGSPFTFGASPTTIEAATFQYNGVDWVYLGFEYLQPA